MTSGSMQLLVDVEIASVAAAAGLSAPRLGRRPLSTVFNRYPSDASPLRTRIESVDANDSEVLGWQELSSCACHSGGGTTAVL